MSATTDDQLKRAADLKLWIESRISELQEETDRLKETLAVIDGVLRASSFRPAIEMAATEARGGTAPAVGEAEEAGPIPEIRELKRDKTNETIAVAQVTRGRVVIEPIPEVSLRLETPPFKSFLLGKILSGMRVRDEEGVGRGRLKKGDELSYSVSDSNSRIRSLTIENYRERERLTEILNTVAWTFSRMLEK